MVIHLNGQQRVERDLPSRGTTCQGDSSILMSQSVRIGKNYINTIKEKRVKKKCRTFIF